PLRPPSSPRFPYTTLFRSTFDDGNEENHTGHQIRSGVINPQPAKHHILQNRNHQKQQRHQRPGVEGPALLLGQVQPAEPWGFQLILFEFVFFLLHGTYSTLYSVIMKIWSKAPMSAAGSSRAYLATPVSSKPASTT